MTRQHEVFEDDDLVSWGDLIRHFTYGWGKWITYKDDGHREFITFPDDDEEVIQALSRFAALGEYFDELDEEEAEEE